MTARLTPKSPSRSAIEKAAQKLGKAEVVKKAAQKLSEGLAPAAKKFAKDELSVGRGKRLAETLNKLTKKPGPGDLAKLLHNQTAATHLKGAINDLLKQIRWGAPLSKADSPRSSVGGQMVAPNGDPLIRVKLSEGSIVGQSQYALVNPKTNEFYIQDNMGGVMHPTNYHGPLSLPPSARFQGDKFTPADLRSLEKAANAEPVVKPPPQSPPFFPGLDKLKFDQPAPKPGDIASERPLKSQHPFSYFAITLKGDPTHVIIKKVLTGGFVPARPGDGSYSAPISIAPIG